MAAATKPRALVYVTAIVVFMVFSLFSFGVVLAAPKASGDGEAVVEKKKPITVISDTMESLRGEGVVIFRGSVVAEQDHLICSDELRVFYDKRQEIDEVVATGNARIVMTGNRGRGDKIVYDKAGEKLTLIGNAAVMQCGDVVRGAKIIFYLDSDNVMVEGGDNRVRAVIMPKKENKECSGDASPGMEGHISEEFQCQRAR